MTNEDFALMTQNDAAYNYALARYAMGIDSPPFMERRPASQFDAVQRQRMAAVSAERARRYLDLVLAGRGSERNLKSFPV